MTSVFFFFSGAREREERGVVGGQPEQRREAKGNGRTVSRRGWRGWWWCPYLGGLHLERGRGRRRREGGDEGRRREREKSPRCHALGSARARSGTWFRSVRCSGSRARVHFCFADEREATGLPPAAGRQGVNKGNLLSFLGFGEHNFSEIDLAPVSSLTEKTEEKKKILISLDWLAQGRLPVSCRNGLLEIPKRAGPKSAVAQSRNRRVVCRSKKRSRASVKERREDLNGRPRGAHNL